MWHAYMTLHAQGFFRGDIPRAWLLERNAYICQQCLQLVSFSRQSSHSRNCTAFPQHPLPVQTNINLSSSNSNQSLPSFDEVCQLNHPAIRFIPSKARPAFARALSSTLKGILRDNNEESWLNSLCSQNVHSHQLSGMEDMTD